MTSPLKTTYGKVILMLFVASISMLGLFGYLYYYTLYEEEMVYKSSNIQFSKEINLLLELKSEPYKNTVDDLTYWDEHVDFIKRRKSGSEIQDDWYGPNVGTMTASYNIDYVATYDMEQNLIADQYTEGFSHKISLSQDFFPYIIKERLTHFYYQSDIGLLEIYAATIHPTNDPQRKFTKPSGVFIMANYLDEEHFKRLKEISSSNLEIMDSIQTPISNKNDVTSMVPLIDFKGNTIETLVFKRPFELNFEMSKEIIKIIVAFFLLALLIITVFLKKYIYLPLYLTTKVLEEGQRSDMNKLRKHSGEFGHIGNLFLDNDIQKIELIAAKEKAEESDKLKSSFLTNLSHEIRTPMNAIIGFTDLLDDNNLPSEEKFKYINIVKRSGKNLVHIIDDLVKMSQIDTKQVKPNYSAFSLNEFMSHIKETISVIVPDNAPLDIVLLIPDNGPESKLISDETKLRQIIINLLNNAIKFTDKGSVNFGYTINYNSGLIEFFISDTGTGIDEKDLNHIFSRFHKIQTNENMNLIGLGLGLSISKAYVEMLEGSIWVQSKKDIGTTFRFTIPLNLKKESKINITDRSLENAKNYEEHLTVLVAEDDNINFMLSKQILSLKNYTVIRAKNGQEAVDICKENDAIDLVLMDIKMPFMTGIEANRIIKTFRPDLPIIAHTAFSSEQDKNKIFEEGFADCVTKPLDKIKLYRSIDRVLAKLDYQ
ncbi:ATP-binding protein [Changchengzhania lutea]|uniref:ATP-binding protein n=1 Tax=Changchengzhania lutea TaxID=2049305 RepID=UPI00115E25E9|nr:ATP-binding protein [Changchengzhania lutea]